MMRKKNIGNKDANNIGKKPNNDTKKIINEKNMNKNAKKNNPKDEQHQKKVKKNTDNSNPQVEQNSSAFSKQKNVHKMMITVDTVPCPKDILTKMNNRQLDRNDRTLFVRFGRETGLKDRQTLLKTFADKVKDIRPHRKYKNINFVELESRDQLEEIKSQIEQMQTAGEKAVVDYMGDKGKFALQNQEMKINPNKLFISNLPKSTTPLQVKSLFEKCSKVTIPKSKLAGGKSYGFIFFDDESDAKSAFESGQNIKIGGVDVTVVFSKVKTHETLKSSEKRPLPQDNENENQVDESPSKKQNIDMEVQQKEDEEEVKDKVDEVKKASDDEEDSDAEEGEDMDQTTEKGDDKDSEESADDENESDDADEEDDGDEEDDDDDEEGEDDNDDDSDDDSDEDDE